MRSESDYYALNQLLIKTKRRMPYAHISTLSRDHFHKILKIVCHLSSVPHLSKKKNISALTGKALLRVYLDQGFGERKGKRHATVKGSNYSGLLNPPTFSFPFPFPSTNPKYKHSLE